MSDVRGVTNPIIARLIQTIKSANDNEIILFDEWNQSFSSRSIYIHKAIQLLKNLIYRFAIFIHTTKLNSFLESLDAKIYLAEAAAFYLKDISTGDAIFAELIHTKKPQYKIKEIKDVIVRIKNAQIAENNQMQVSIFSRTIKNTYFNFKSYKQDYNDYSNNIRQYISFVFADHTNLEDKNTKNTTACAITFFKNKGLEINNNVELKAVFKQELLQSISNDNNSKLNFTKLAVFANSGLLPIILEVCATQKIDIYDYLNSMSNDDMKYWDDNLALKKIIMMANDNINSNNLDKTHFADLLLKAIKNINHSGINPVLNLLYSDINNPNSLANIKPQQLLKLLELLVRSNKKEKIEYTKYILECSNHSEDLDYIDKILFFAVVYTDDKDFIQELISKGANINLQLATEKQNTLLMIAVKQHKNEIAKELIKNNADLNKKNTLGYTALSLAVLTNNLYLVTLLIENGANVNAETTAKDSVLIDSVFINNPEITQMLIIKGAGIDLQNIEGDTVLIKAAKLNRLNIIKQLTQYKADVNLQNIKGNTALIEAVLRNNIEIVKTLIAEGADIELPNKNDETALTIARRSNNQDLMNLLFVKKM